MKKNKIKSSQFNVINGRGINFVLNQAYELLGNPIALFDTTYKLLAHTENRVEDDILWNELIKLGGFSHETVNFFSKENFISDVAASEVLTLLYSKSLKYNRINAKIYDNNGTHIANIIIIACYKPFEDNNLKEIEMICKSLSLELEKSEYYQDVDRILEETFVSNLIEDKIKEKPYIQNNLEELYKNLKNNLYVAVIDITKYEYTLTHLTYFRDLFKTIQKDFKYFIYLNNIVAIISTDNPILNITKDLSKMNKFCAANNIYIGISESFQNLLELQKYYKQALNALNYGLNTNVYNEHYIFDFVNFKLDCFFNEMRSNEDIKSLCHPIVTLIQKYDKDNNCSYYEILSTYISVGRNVSLAAQKMDMTSKQLSQDLKKITSLFGIDWNNGDMILSIFFSIKLLKYIS